MWLYVDLTIHYRIIDNPMVRLISLANGPENIGRIAIYHDGLWGTISRIGISDQFIGLLCKAAGFQSYGIQYLGPGRY